MSRLFAVAALLLLLPGEAGAQQACAAVAEPWRQARTLASAMDARAANRARFATGQAGSPAAAPDGEVAYVTLPKGAGEAASFGGMATFEAARAGVYRVALEKSAWVDVVADGKPAPTVRFGRGADCSGVQKAVEFRLDAGPHVIELSGSKDRELGIIVSAIQEGVRVDPPSP
ncbi:MAG: hypothetical protein JO097_21485 [Acidobacteriaceae bacterium]|nr:hypothetical protein [Acidobacteriaceae bacterium]